jgi:hypothetical protein
MKHRLTIHKHAALALLLLVGSLITKHVSCTSSIDNLAAPHIDRPEDDVVLSRITHHFSSIQGGVHKGSSHGSSSSTRNTHQQRHVDRILQFKKKTATKGQDEKKQGQAKMKSTNKTTKNAKGKNVKSKAGIQKKKTTNKVQQKKQSKVATKMKDADQQMKVKDDNDDNNTLKNNDKTSNGENDEKKKMMSNVQKMEFKKKNDDNDENNDKDKDKDKKKEDDNTDDEADDPTTSSPTLMPTLSPTIEPTSSPTLAPTTTNDDDDEKNETTNDNNNLDENDNDDTEAIDKNDNSRRISPRYTSELCLASQKDSYRTCYQRHIDPTLLSSIKCDSITNRKEYTPFTKPYISSDEELITGTMVLTMLLSDDTTTTPASISVDDDDTVVLLNCRESFKLEETVLTYLSDNIGSETTFTPVCVYLEKYAYSKSRKEVGEGGGRTLALEFEVTYIHNNNNNNNNNNNKRNTMPSSSSRNGNGRMLGYDERIHPTMKLEVESTVGLELGKVSTTIEMLSPDEQMNDQIMDMEETNNNRGLKKKTKQNVKGKSKLTIGKGKKKKMMSDIQKKDEEVIDDNDEEDEDDDDAEDDDEVVPTLMPTTAEEDTDDGEEIDEEYTNTKECTAIQTALCCSQLAINAASPPPGRGGTRAGIYCDSLNCSFRKQCGTGRMSSKQVFVDDRELQVKREDADNNENDETTSTVMEVVAVEIVYRTTFQLPIQHGLTTIKDVALTTSVQRTVC